jgi:hypothetical protein
VKDWRLRAACRPRKDATVEEIRWMLDIFYPPRGGQYAADIEETSQAKAYCAACPVRISCLKDALATHDNEFGTRGGYGPKERRINAVKLRKALAGVEDAA